MVTAWHPTPFFVALRPSNLSPTLTAPPLRDVRHMRQVRHVREVRHVRQVGVLKALLRLLP